MLLWQAISGDDDCDDGYNDVAGGASVVSAAASAAAVCAPLSPCVAFGSSSSFGFHSFQ